MIIFETVRKIFSTYNVVFIGVPLHVCNDEVYGFVMVPLEKEETIVEDMQRLTNTKAEILSKLLFYKITI